MSVTDDLHKLVLASVGAASVAVEKTQEAIETLAKRGEETLEQGKELNERLHHNMQQSVSDSEAVVQTNLTKDAILQALDLLSPEELVSVEAKLRQLIGEQAHEQTK